MTREEIINALQSDKMMPYIQPEQLANIVDFVSENCKPSLPEGLDEAAEKASKTWRRNEDGSEERELFPQTFIRGFIAGAEYQREQDQQLTELAEDHAMLAGMNKMKEEMLKDAVGGEVCKFGEVAYVKERNHVELIKYLSQFNNGDRVKIIVIHETDIR